MPTPKIHEPLQENKQDIKRGSIYRANLDPTFGSEQGGSRPVLVIQNDIGNRFSPTVIVAAITSQKKSLKIPTHILIPPEYGMEKESTILLEQIRTIDKRRLEEKITDLDESFMDYVDRLLEVSLGIKNTRQEVSL
jgi:mRNA interferase MazF